MEGNLARELRKNARASQILAGMLCDIQREVHELRVVLVDRYPEIVTRALYGGKGFAGVRKGEAIEIRQCTEVHRYEIIWERKLKGACYVLYPVILANDTVRFLELSSRNIYIDSPTLECNNRENYVYVKDFRGVFWKYGLDRNITRIEVSRDKFHKVEFPVHDLGTFNETLLHYERVQHGDTTLLHLISEQRENLEFLMDNKQRGGGDLLKGILNGLVDITEDLVEGGEKVVGLVTDGVVDLTNDTVGSVEGLGHGVSNFFSSGAGISDLILYIICGAIVLYLVRLRRVDGYDPPPVPVRRMSHRE